MFTQEKLSRRGLINLFIVYIAWGTTYLAMRVGVREGSGFGVFTFASLRFILISPVLFGIAKLAGDSLKIKKKDLLKLIVFSIGIWGIGHGSVLYATKYMESGFASVVVASTPIWMALTSGVVSRNFPRASNILFMLLGFAGIAVLIFPKLKMSVIGDHSGTGILLLLFGTISWSVFSVLMNKFPIKAPSLTLSAYQQTIGGLYFLVATFIMNEPLPIHPSTDALWALVYIMIFGSAIAYSSFVDAITLLPPGIASTYAYVNPVIAVILGVLILNEEMDRFIIVGIVLIIASVAGIFKTNGKT
jgi:drug/metabolite transporter (DMT)-like permease